MTAQIPEELSHEGQQWPLFTEPLAAYFKQTGLRPGFVSPHTALWRGYVGSWLIEDGYLYLTALQGHLRDGSEATLHTLFPDAGDRVKADWFTGTLRVPQGSQLEYVHMGFGSVFERELRIDVEAGKVLGQSFAE
ncbi:hypothetical protein [Aquabacterium sp.]|uniref:hypothetical protein n=1 Tax=Aquabacterium sp. TaxID=1872578 RepID=UPI003B746883